MRSPLPRPASRRVIPVLALLLGTAGAAALAGALLPGGSASSTPTGVGSTAAAPSTSTGRRRSAPPDVGAAAYVVLDGRSRRILGARDADVPRPVGSIAKLATALVVLDAGDLDRPVTIADVPTERGEAVAGLEPGEQLTRRQLLALLLVPSAGDAAEALAIDVAGSRDAFVARMNALGRRLGLRRTTFANPTGLDAPGAASTARDVARLAYAAMQRPELRAIVARTAVHIHGRRLAATNRLLADPAVDGVKTGHTDEAGWCLVASARQGGRRIYAVVLGARSEDARDADARALLRWAAAA